jgi:hypothetical protein
MNRSDLFGLSAVIIAAPHVPEWWAIGLAFFWAGMAIYLESKGK